MNKRLYAILCILLYCFIGCDDLFIENISDDCITLVAPGENLKLTNPNVSLVWEALEGAEEYQVVVVSPAFNRIESYVCDSITTDYKLKLTLKEGQYEWSVQARNSGYTSLKSIGKFEIIAQ